MQNQQLLHITANAPEGLRLICTGNDMRWIDTVETQKQGRLVFAHLPAMSHGPGQPIDVAKHAEHQSHTEHQSHAEHHLQTDHSQSTDQQLHIAHQHDDHAAQQPIFAEGIHASLSITDLACPDQILSELQHSLGFSANALLLSVATQSTLVYALPQTPYSPFKYPSHLSRAPPVVAV